MFFTAKNGIQQASKVAYVDPGPNGWLDAKGQILLSADNIPWYYNETIGKNGKVMGVLPKNTGAKTLFEDSPSNPNNPAPVVFKTWLVAIDKNGSANTWQQANNKGWDWTGIGFQWTWTPMAITGIKIINGNPPANLRPDKIFFTNG